MSKAVGIASSFSCVIGKEEVIFRTKFTLSINKIVDIFADAFFELSIKDLLLGASDNTFLENGIIVMSNWAFITFSRDKVVASSTDASVLGEDLVRTTVDAKILKIVIVLVGSARRSAFPQSSIVDGTFWTLLTPFPDIDEARFADTSSDPSLISLANINTHLRNLIKLLSIRASNAISIDIAIKPINAKANSIHILL